MDHRMTQKEIDEALVLAMEADKREIERLRADLSASQAREKVLRSALDLLTSNGRIPPTAKAFSKASHAASIPADDTALRAALAQAQEEMRERCAKKCEDDMYYEIGGACAEAIRALEAKP